MTRSTNVNVFFKSVDAKRNFPLSKGVDKVNINTNISFHKKEREKKNNLKMKFTANMSYNPGIGQMNLSGVVVVKGDKRELDKIEENPSETILNLVGKRSVTQFVKLAEQVQIPPPLPNLKSGGEGAETRGENGRMFG